MPIVHAMKRPDLFDAVVCREDAAAKPDPAPVRAALARLGVGRAWMVGDTPGDVVAARGARVVPIGVLAPEGDRGATPGSVRAYETALSRAGAARVLGRTLELDELLEEVQR